MRKIECDICSRKIEPSEQEDLTDTVDRLMTNYANMTNPDLCFNCLDDLSKILKEAIIQWKLAGRRK